LHRFVALAVRGAAQESSGCLAVLSTIATSIQLIVVLAATNIEVLRAVIVPIAFAGAASGFLPAPEKITSTDAAVPILIALSTNTITKAVLCFSTGSRGFALRAIPGLILVGLTSWVGVGVFRSRHQQLTAANFLGELLCDEERSTAPINQTE
jgi:hypothetical protein